ncbi:MAG: hypothetical protein HDS43_03215 [Bacteroides sp.]|nr:hypothetical protein [Bacteroides sp.]
MTARDVLSPLMVPADEMAGLRIIDGDMPLVDVLPRLLDSGSHSLAVADGDVTLGVITETSLLEGLGRMIAPRDDSSVITLECRPEDYSASMLAHAVENTDSHLVDFWSVPAADGMLRVTLRVRCSDPSAAVRSLERYDFRVVEASGSMVRDAEIASERLLALQTLLNV